MAHRAGHVARKKQVCLFGESVAIRAIGDGSNVGDPASSPSIAGGDGDGRAEPPPRWTKTMEESLLHRFGRLGCKDRRTHPFCVAKRREGAPSLHICPSDLLRNLRSFPLLPRPLLLFPKVSRSFHAVERVETARSGAPATHL